MIVLNVGGGTNRNLPPEFDGWDQVLLDIDPECKPDICLDAKKLKDLDGGQYDAVFCSHNLEHFYAHDVPVVLAGFLHVLKDGGFAQIAVPSLTRALDAMRERSLDIGDVWYRTSAGSPITFHDVLYGWGHAMEAGNLFYAHKCGFTRISLGDALLKAGFAGVRIGEDAFNLVAMAYKAEQHKCL